mmetsp:Transcript_12512/g.14370  ORF Transcript_12512/g.14370 Transcript_12512/m.14370 type:complete len:94 (+) Transcript_12512:169-450(+)
MSRNNTEKDADQRKPYHGFLSTMIKNPIWSALMSAVVLFGVSYCWYIVISTCSNSNSRYGDLIGSDEERLEPSNYEERLHSSTGQNHRALIEN